jgi:hypothetical protein
MYFVANLVQFFLPVPAGIFKAMQDDSDSLAVEVFQLIPNIDNSSVVGRIRNIEGDDVQVFIRHIVDRLR